MAKQKFYYGVKQGHKPGVYDTWAECAIQVNKFPNAIYKKFENKDEAEAFIKGEMLKTEKAINRGHVYYAVKEGFKPGIYTNWAKCMEQIKGFRRPIYKKFTTKIEAEDFLNDTVNPRVQIKKYTNTAVEEKNKYYAYVDGSYINGRYGWGLVIYYNGEIILKNNGCGNDPKMAEAHNVAGEILGAMEAAKWAYANDEKIILCHDYEGIAKWALGLWKRNKELTVNYHNFMQEYLPLITFKHVRGHTGIVGNELADKLAKEAIGLV